MQGLRKAAQRNKIGPTEDRKEVNIERVQADIFVEQSLFNMAYDLNSTYNRDRHFMGK